MPDDARTALTMPVNRRRFLALLPGLVVLPPSAVAAKRPRERLLLVATHVAGTAYYEAEAVRDGLRPGEALALRREPGNPHDALAIEVLTRGGRKLGYVPRADNPALARLMDAGETLIAEVDSVDPRRWDDVHMRLFLLR